MPPAPSTDETTFGSEPSGNAWLPKLFFLALVLITGALAVIEVRSRLERPSVMRRDGEGAKPDLVFYQKGPPAHRVAWLLSEPGGKGGPPRLIQRIPCSPLNTAVGEIRRTRDGRAVYAARRAQGQVKTPEILWLHTFADGRLFICDEGYSLRGTISILQSPDGLLSQWKKMGGAGDPVASWYELGAQGNTLWSWQTTRWEQALPK